MDVLCTKSERVYVNRSSMYGHRNLIEENRKVLYRQRYVITICSLGSDSNPGAVGLYSITFFFCSC